MCDPLSLSVRIWHGGHIAAGGGIFPQQRGGHLLPGAGSGLQWICHIRLVEKDSHFELIRITIEVKFSL